VIATNLLKIDEEKYIVKLAKTKYESAEAGSQSSLKGRWGFDSFVTVMSFQA